MAKGSGEIRKGRMVIETPQGLVIIYRLPNGKLGARHPPGTRVLKTSEVRKLDISESGRSNSP